MVRINLISPDSLADQHLIAEYDEILMLLGYVRRYGHKEVRIPERFSLGKGHIIFFKDKLLYLKKRHEKIRLEMKKRGFQTNKKIDLKEFNKILNKDWNPSEDDKNIVKSRIIEKIEKKPEYYRYYGNHVPKIELIRRIIKSP